METLNEDEKQTNILTKTKTKIQMKKKILSILAVMLMTLTANAQHDYVDLGLPSGTLWATCNVGANSPEEYGDYFAWGETSEKDYYDYGTYEYCNGTFTSFTKYCTSSEYGNNGFTDGKTVLEPADDAATVNMGDSWCTPSLKQLQELIGKCSRKWTQMNGVEGILLTGPNGNQIFLPAAGYRWEGELNTAGFYGSYRSNSICQGADQVSYYIWFDSNNNCNWEYLGGRRAEGNSVRAVRVPEKEVYTEFVEATGTLTYYYDNQRGSRSGVTEPYDPANASDVPRFTGYNKKVLKAVIDPSMKNAPLTSTYYMFFGGINNETFAFQVLSNMTEIGGMENLNTANVTRMDYMFEGCNSLQTVDVSSFDISNVTRMDFMFGDCYKLTTIYCDKDWSTSTAKSDYMFATCKLLVGGKGTVFDSNVIDKTYARPDGGEARPGYFSEKPSPKGDLNSDGKVDIADAVTVLNIMAAGGYEAKAELNDDQKIDIADFVTVLNIMAAQ